jgi:ATP adenylyltransferase
MRVPSVVAISIAFGLAACLVACGEAPAPESTVEDPKGSPCPFCQIAPEEIVAVDGPSMAFRDAFPASPGHTLIIPRRHVSSVRELTAEEWSAIGRLAQRLANDLQRADPSITGFNFGANDGVDAGQSVLHCHFHLIPRRPGDTPNPRGGIRKAISGRSDDRSKP